MIPTVDEPIYSNFLVMWYDGYDRKIAIFHHATQDQVGDFTDHDGSADFPMEDIMLTVNLGMGHLDEQDACVDPDGFGLQWLGGLSKQNTAIAHFEVSTDGVITPVKEGESLRDLLDKRDDLGETPEDPSHGDVEHDNDVDPNDGGSD